jgi:hypothetical protein
LSGLRSRQRGASPVPPVDHPGSRAPTRCRTPSPTPGRTRWRPGRRRAGGRRRPARWSPGAVTGVGDGAGGTVRGGARVEPGWRVRPDQGDPWDAAAATGCGDSGGAGAPGRRAARSGTCRSGARSTRVCVSGESTSRGWVWSWSGLASVSCRLLARRARAAAARVEDVIDLVGAEHFARRPIGPAAVARGAALPVRGC